MRCARFGIHNITYCVDIVIIDYCKTGTGNSSILMCVFAVLHRTINFACGGLSCFPPEQVVL